MAADATKPDVSVRTEAAAFDAYGNANQATVYADGVHQISVGAAVSRLTFFTTPGPIEEEGRPIEQRHVSFALVIPTVVLLQTFNNFIVQLKLNMPALEQHLNVMGEMLTATKDLN